MISLIASLLSVGQVQRDVHDLNVMCGAHSLYIALGVHDFPVGRFEQFQKLLGRPTQYGYSLLDLEDAARQVGAEAASVHGSLNDFATVAADSSIIALMNPGHFVVVEAFTDDYVTLADPPNRVEMSRAVFDEGWTGDALIVSRKPIPAFGSRATTSARWWVGGVALVGALVAAAAYRFWSQR